MPQEPQQRVIHDISASAVFKVVAILALCGVIYFLRDMVLIVLVAVVISSAIEPATKWFIRHHIPRVAAVIIEFFALALTISLLFYFLIIPLIGETATFIQSLPAYLQSAPFLSSTGPLASGHTDVISSTFSLQNILGQLNGAVANLSQGLFSTLATVFGGVFSFLIIIVLSIYLSVQERGISRFIALIAPAKIKPYALSLWDRAEIQIGHWMQGQLLLAATIFIVVYIGLLAFGIQHALLLAFLAGFLEIIPVVGPIIAALPAVVLALSTGDLWFGIWITIFYTLVQQFESHIVYPQVVKKVIGLPPIISILSLIAGGELLGFLGIVIAVPVATILMEFMGDMQKKGIDEEIIPQ